MFAFIIICPGLCPLSASFLHLCFTPSLFSSLHYMLLSVWPIKYLTARFVVLFSLRNILDQRCMALCLAPLLGDNYCGVSSYLSSFSFFFFLSPLTASSPWSWERGNATSCVFAYVSDESEVALRYNFESLFFVVFFHVAGFSLVGWMLLLINSVDLMKAWVRWVIMLVWSV